MIKRVLSPSLGHVVKSFSLLYQSNPALTRTKMGITLVQSILPVLQLAILKQLIDSLTLMFENTHLPQSYDFWKWAVLFCAVTLVWRLFSVFLQSIDELLRQDLMNTIYAKVHAQSIALGMSYFDNPGYFDTLHRAQQESASQPMDLMDDLFNAFSSAITLIGIFSVIMGMNSGAGLLLMILGIPLLVTRLGRSRQMFAWRKNNTTSFRKTSYLDRLITSRETAKEVRVFVQGPYLRGRFLTVRQALQDSIVRLIRKRGTMEIFAVLFEIAALVGVLVLLFQQVGLNTITVGGFVMIFEAFRKGQTTVLTLVTSMASFYARKLSLVHLFDFLDLPKEEIGPNPPAGADIKLHRTFPDRITSLEFDHVSFQYPDSKGWAIEDVTFRVEPGKIVLLKGLNGTGKSTIMKLIARLYVPEKGQIRINGIDIQTFPRADYHQYVGVILQDFVQYNFTLRENVQLGRKDMPNAWRDTLADFSGVNKILHKLPLGYDSLLGKMFQGGTEMSMGQWQSIALMRALWTNPPVWILDEPTGWMDAEKENHFLETLPELAKDRLVILSHHAPVELLHKIIDVQVIAL